MLKIYVYVSSTSVNTNALAYESQRNGFRKGWNVSKQKVAAVEVGKQLLFNR